MIALASGLLLLLASPARPSDPPPFAGGWQADAGWVASGVLLHVAAKHFDSTLGTPACPCRPESVPGFDRWPIGRDDEAGARGSDAGRDLLTFGSPLAAALLDPGRTGTRVQAGFVVAESILVTSGVTQLLKGTIHRPRPWAYDGTPFSGRPYTAMPSGHTSASFAAATSLVAVLHQRRPGWRATPWIATGGYAVAATVGVLRVESGRHFPSDVVAGAALGASTGWLVARSRATVTPLPRGIGIFVAF